MEFWSGTRLIRVLRGELPSGDWGKTRELKVRSRKNRGARFWTSLGEGEVREFKGRSREPCHLSLLDDERITKHRGSFGKNSYPSCCYLLTESCGTETIRQTGSVQKTEGSDRLTEVKRGRNYEETNG